MLPFHGVSVWPGLIRSGVSEGEGGCQTPLPVSLGQYKKCLRQNCAGRGGKLVSRHESTVLRARAQSRLVGTCVVCGIWLIHVCVWLAGTALGRGLVAAVPAVVVDPGRVAVQ